MVSSEKHALPLPMIDGAEVSGGSGGFQANPLFAAAYRLHSRGGPEGPASRPDPERPAPPRGQLAAA